MMTFVKNAGITLITSIFTLIIGVVISVIVARILGPRGQGFYSITMLLPLMIVTFTNLGIARSTVYHIGRGIYPLKDLVGTILTSIFIISIVSIIVGLITIFFFSNSIFLGVSRIFLLLSLLLIPFQLFFYQFLSGILLGIQKIKEYNFFVIIRSISSLLFVCLFLLGLNTGVIGVIIANLFSLLFAGLIAYIWMFKFLNGVPFSFRIDKKILYSLFSFGYKVHLNNVLAFLHLRIDIFMLNFLINPLAVGFYVISVGIAERLWMLSQAVSTVLYPKVVSMKDELQRNEFTSIVARSTLLITIFGAFSFFILSKWLIILLYSKRYLNSVAPFQILLIGVVAISISRVLTNDIDARGKPMINTYITFVTLIGNIVLNIILIPKYGVIGAALATSISYSLSSIIKIFIYCKISGNPVINVIMFKKSDIKLFLKVLNIFCTKVRE